MFPKLFCFVYPYIPINNALTPLHYYKTFSIVIHFTKIAINRLQLFTLKWKQMNAMIKNQTHEVSSLLSFLMRHLSLFVFTAFDASEGNHSETLLALAEIYLSCFLNMHIYSVITEYNSSVTTRQLSLKIFIDTMQSLAIYPNLNHDN